MPSFNAICLRCPNYDDGIMCDCKCASGEFKNPTQCIGKNFGTATTDLWWGFESNPSSDPSTFLTTVEACQDLLKQVIEVNTKTLPKANKKKSNEQSKEVLEKAKAAAKFLLGDAKVPVTKQILEYAFQLVYVVNVPEPVQKPAAEATVNTESTAVNKESTAVNKGSTTVNEESTAVSKESTIVNEESTAVNKESTIVNEESTAVNKESTIVSKENTRTAINTIAEQDVSASSGELRQRPAPKEISQHPDFGRELPAQDVRVPTWSVAQPSTYHTPSKSTIYNKAIHENCPLKTLDDKAVAARTGSSGEHTRVTTNYLHVTGLPQQVYEYVVEYGPVIKFGNDGRSIKDDEPGTSSNASDREKGLKQRSQKKKVFERLRVIAPFNGRNDWATDFGTVWSIRQLGLSPGHEAREPSVGEILQTDQVDFHKFSGKPCSIAYVKLTLHRKLRIKEGADLDPHRLMELNGDGASVQVTALNGLISANIASNNSIIAAGANKFYSKSDHHDFLGIQAHRGYYSSIRPGTEHVLLNISTMTGAFYTPTKVSEFMDLMRSDKDFLEYGPYHVRCERLLVGREVRIMYNRAMHIDNYNPNAEANRHRVIAGLGDIPSRQLISHSGGQISVLQYFRDVLHARPVPSDKYRCVNIGAKPKPEKCANPDPATVDRQIYIPAEYLSIDPDQFFGRRLASSHMEKLHNVALLHPAATQDKIIGDGFRLMGISGGAGSLLSLGVNLVPQLLSIPARLLREPSIAYQKTKMTVSGASWNLRGVKFMVPASTSHLTALDFRKTMRGGQLEGLAVQVSQAMRTTGMTVPQLPTRMLGYWWSGNYTPYTKFLPKDFTDAELVQQLTQDRIKMGNPGMHVVILEDTNSDSYATIKRVFDQHIGVHTVCITAPKIKPGANIQLFANLALKYNIKARGINWNVVQANGSSAFKAFDVPTMVVGADVSHAPSQMAGCPSVAAVVASDERSFAHFPGSMRLQAAKQEFLQDLSGMMIERLLRFGAVNKFLPSRIVFYRDGVGEDMYERVRKEEIKQIRSAYEYVRTHSQQLIGNGKLPSNMKIYQKELRLTFIIVGKRHNTRFFCQTADQSHDLGFTLDFKVEKWQQSVARKTRNPKGSGYVGVINGNVKPGLVVDRVITRPAVDDTMDFFLQSHQALKGTARSAHYVVLESGGFTMDSIQNFTFAFCYNFARATTGVSYAGPAYYADRLADRGTHYLKAYTTGRTRPDLAMNAEENTEPRKPGLMAYDRRVAQHIQNSLEWNPRRNARDPGALTTRINPWHPNMDEVMFWL